MAADLVSVVVPARNGGRFLADAITSALDQGANPVEVIVVDDASQDDTRAVAERFRSGVRVERLGGVGPAAARNHGVAVARGRWLAFLDADDVWAANKLERQLGELAHRQADALALGTCRQFSGEAARAEAMHPRPPRTCWARRSYGARCGNASARCARTCVSATSWNGCCGRGSSVCAS